MSKPRTKKYRPKNKNPSGGLAVIAMREELHPNSAKEASRLHHLSLGMIEQGMGRFDDLNIVAGALHAAKALCEAGYGPEFEPELITALEGMDRALQRAIASSGIGFDGPGLIAVRAGLMIHDAQIEGVQAGHFIAAVKEVQRRSIAGIAYGVAA